MDIVVLILAAIFFFTVAVLFRSNEALDRVGEVEKEVAEIEKGLPLEAAQEPVPPAQDIPLAADAFQPQAGIPDAPFPKPEDVHMN
jgi:hypothetical protein